MNQQTKRTREFHHGGVGRRMNYKWGVWHFDEERLALQHKDGTYCIELIGLDSENKLLGQLAHLCQYGKDIQYGETAAGDLLHALNEIFYFEGHLTGWKPLENFDTKALLEAYVQRFHQEKPKSRLHRRRWRKLHACKYVMYTIPFVKIPRTKRPVWDRELNTEFWEYMDTCEKNREPIYVS